MRAPFSDKRAGHGFFESNHEHFVDQARRKIFDPGVGRDWPGPHTYLPWKDVGPEIRGSRIHINRETSDSVSVALWIKCLTQCHNESNHGPRLDLASMQGS